MRHRSIRLRLLVLSGLSIASVLSLIGFGLLWLFQNQLLIRTHTELGHQLNQLAAAFSEDESGAAVVEDAMTDPRYEQPLSGLFWQVSQNGKAILRSRSLWDTQLPDLSAAQPYPSRPVAIPGPGRSKLISLSRVVALHNTTAANKATLYRLAVAVDTSEMERDRNEVFRSLSLILTLSGFALISFAWVQIQFGLRPLDAVRQKLEVVRRGGHEHLDESSFPLEVQPLVHEINDLLEAQRAAVERARQRSIDLAHGLKTPIAAIAAQLDRMKDSGPKSDQQQIFSNLDAMQRHVEAELARVRAQGGHTHLTHATNVAHETKSVIAILKKLPHAEHVNWTVDVDPELSIAMEKEDFAEVLGNLLDNAGKWAKSLVHIKARASTKGLRVSIEDDGKGIDKKDRPNAIARGVRLDQQVPGTGLGLSIVQAILETYGSNIEMKKSPAGGLQVSFAVPG